MSSLKKLAGDTAVYGLSSILGRMVNFLLVPFYTGLDFADHPRVTTAQFGVINEFYSYVAFLNIIYLFGMETAFFRFAEKSKSQEAFNAALSQIFIVAIGLSSCFLIFAEPLANLLDYPEKANYIRYLAIVLAIDAIVAIPFARLRRERKAKKFALVKLINIFLNVGLNIFFITICFDIFHGQYLTGFQTSVRAFYNPELKVAYIFLANLIANAFMIIMLMGSYRGFRFNFNRQYRIPMFRYAYPLVFVGLAGMVNEVIDRVLLKEITPGHLYPGKSNQDVVGVYSAAYKLSIFIALVNQAFRYAAEPFFFSKAKDRNAPEVFAAVMKWYIIACVLMLLVVSVFRDVIGLALLRDASFREGLYIVPILLLAQVFLGIYYNLSVWYKLTDKTKYGTYISVWGAVVTLGLNYLLIPVVGYLGSAITTLVCYFSMVVVSYYYGQKYFPVPYQLKSALFYLALVSMLIALTYLELAESFWTNQLLNAAIVLFFLAFAYLRERRNLPTRKT